MIKKSFSSLSIPFFAILSAAATASAAQRNVDFNGGWRFALVDPADAAAVDCSDAEWKAVCLPHDWTIAGPFNPEESGRTGKLPWRGIGWYRKTCTLAGAEQGNRVCLDFDGVMAFPKVDVNGRLAGEWDYGYMAFRVEATPTCLARSRGGCGLAVDDTGLRPV